LGEGREGKPFDYLMIDMQKVRGLPMYAFTEERLVALMQWVEDKIIPWIELLIESNKNLVYYLIVLVFLIAILVQLRKENRKKSGKRKKGFKNFKGDIWYADGTMWHEDKKTWEEPDYKNKK
jgi:hypothetical protein